MQIIGDVLREVLQTRTAFDPQGAPVALTSGLPIASASVIQRLIVENKHTRCLEVGMAMGVSTMAILYALQELGGGTHVAIDPNQTSSSELGWRGIGKAMVARSELSQWLEVIEEPSYAALPALLREGRKFDFVLIDGWHSFNHTFIDFFYADLLLEDGGLLVIDDIAMPQVQLVGEFVETHKAYERLGPKRDRTFNPVSGLKRILRRRGGLPGFAETSDSEWGSIQAYRKLRSSTVPWDFNNSDFYPYYRVYRWWMRLLGRNPQTPT